MTFTSVEQCQDWLDSFIQQGTLKSNERFLTQLEKLGWEKGNAQIILVGGTNGKGSTCVFLESILQAAGYRTGCYLSPHVLSISERIRINSAPISEAEFCYAFNKVKTLYENLPIHWFELMTVVGFAAFMQHKLDFLIVEVGIGGRNDVTNALAPDLSIITSIGLDHQEILGETLAEIAAEKSGIFRAHHVGICGEPNPPQTLIDYAKKIGCQLWVAERDFHSAPLAADGWSWNGPHLSLTDLPIPNLPLINASTALAAIDYLSNSRRVLKHDRQIAISNTAIYQGLVNATLPGRWQIINEQPLIVLDVAHNAQGFAYIAQKIEVLPSAGKTYIVCAMQDRKNSSAALAAFTTPVDSWYLAPVHSGDQFPEVASQYLIYAKQTVVIEKNVLAAYQKAKENAGKNDRIVVLGSFLTVAQVLESIES